MDAYLKTVVGLCCLFILAGKVFLHTVPGQKADQSIRAHFSKIKENKRFSARFLMFWLRHPAYLGLVVLMAIVAGGVLYAYLAY